MLCSIWRKCPANKNRIRPALLYGTLNVQPLPGAKQEENTRATWVKGRRTDVDFYRSTITGNTERMYLLPRNFLSAFYYKKTNYASRLNVFSERCSQIPSNRKGRKLAMVNLTRNLIKRVVIYWRRSWSSLWHIQLTKVRCWFVLVLLSIRRTNVARVNIKRKPWWRLLS